MKVRIIYYSSPGGTIEGVYFTEDFEMDATDVLPHNCTVDGDFITDGEYPNAFPLDYNMERRAIL